MRWFNFEQNGQRRLGAKAGEALVDVTALGASRLCRILDYLRLSEDERREFDALVSARAASLPRLAENDIRFLSVVEAESKFMCIGQNYADHCREQGVELPATPILFAKMNNALAGHRETIPMPVTTTAVDFEVELAAIVGRACRRVAPDQALAHVAGYTVVNDISARDHQRRDGQWVRAKSLDKFGPNGPFLVTADEVANPHHLNLWLDLNGRRMQQFNTSNLVFNIPYLIHYYSQDITLQPGDLLSTGTPPGVGCFRKPPVWVQPGDVMEATVEGLGTLVNRLGQPA
jgi:2-keto-4-pentenoate hydratase/2-oxohepta-3-ene-1,7-dioic acid hydratase in catechol pathway